MSLNTLPRQHNTVVLVILAVLSILLIMLGLRLRSKS